MNRASSRWTRQEARKHLKAGNPLQILQAATNETNLGIARGMPLAYPVAVMSTAIVVFLVVIAIVAGTIVTLRTTARQGLPSKDVMDRARQRAREQNARDEAEQRRN